MSLGTGFLRGTEILYSPGVDTVGRVLVQMREVFGRDAEAAATAVDAALRRGPVLLVPALDRAMRDAETVAGLGFGFLEISVEQVSRLERFGERASALLGVASLARDGHTRQAAVERLAERVDRLTTAFLINRINDYVGPVATLAAAAVEARLRPELAGLLVACLPLIVRMGQWTRAKQAQERLLAFVRSSHPVVRGALWAGLTASDGEVVLRSAVLLAQLHRGTAEMERVLAAALAVREPRTRRWAARVASDEKWTPAAVLHALAGRMAEDRMPAVRLVGLQGMAQRGEQAAIERAAIDTNAEVRHQARVLLAKNFRPLDYRGVALGMLAEGTDRKVVIPALALLSEFGRGEDRGVLERFAGDPRPAVAREAVRALARLP